MLLNDRVNLTFRYGFLGCINFRLSCIVFQTMHNERFLLD